MKKTNGSALAFALTLAMAASWLGHATLSSAQPNQEKDYGSRKKACGCYVCGTLMTVNFANMDKDCAGILAEDACHEPLAALPPDQRSAFCAAIRARFNFRTFAEGCPAFASDCASESPPAKGAARGGTTALPPVARSDRDGLDDGFGGPPASPPKGGVSPPRLAYLVPGSPDGGKRVTEFTVFLDLAACPIPLAADNRPANPSAAKHVVRGRILRGDGRVRIEAEASDASGGAKRGPFVGESGGDAAAAVASATRAMTKQMDLVCRR